MKPLVLDVQEDSEQVYVSRTGREFGNPRLTVDREISEELRLGYRCANCLERFSLPWPKVCSFCGVFVREQQAEFFAKQYRGEEHFDGTDWDAERAYMLEEYEREEARKHGR